MGVKPHCHVQNYSYVTVGTDMSHSLLIGMECRDVYDEVPVEIKIPGGEEEEGDGGRLHLMLRCHHQNDSCVKMGSDECHYNVSVTMSIDHTFEERGKLSVDLQSDLFKTDN